MAGLPILFLSLFITTTIFIFYLFLYLHLNSLSPSALISEKISSLWIILLSKITLPSNLNFGTYFKLLPPISTLLYPLLRKISLVWLFNYLSRHFGSLSTLFLGPLALAIGSLVIYFVTRYIKSLTSPSTPESSIYSSNRSSLPKLSISWIAAIIVFMSTVWLLSRAGFGSLSSFISWLSSLFTIHSTLSSTHDRSSDLSSTSLSSTSSLFLSSPPSLSHKTTYDLSTMTSTSQFNPASSDASYCSTSTFISPTHDCFS